MFEIDWFVLCFCIANITLQNDRCVKNPPTHLASSVLDLYKLAAFPLINLSNIRWPPSAYQLTEDIK